MKVLHVGTLDVRAGGPAMSTYLTLSGLRCLGVDASIIMYPLSKKGELRGTEVPVHYATSPWEARFGYSPSLRAGIKSIKNVDIYHAQGVWQYPTFVLADVAKAMRKPYLITPRGMLYPQDIAKSSTALKKILLKWRLLQDLNKAACVQVTCEEEMMHCRKLGVTSPIAVIPNPVEIKEYKEMKKDAIFRLGYLGRLSPRKNVEGLIYAFAELGVEAKGSELLIIGGGDASYEQFLKNEVHRLRLKNVRFTGFLSGKKKDEALASLSVLAMPSEFENLGNVILEGLVRKIPCIATKGTPWKDLKKCNCGWWIDYDQQVMTETIRQALYTAPEELIQMGERGRRLVEKFYSVHAVSFQIKQLYEWILEKREKPNCVFDEPRKES